MTKTGVLIAGAATLVLLALPSTSADFAASTANGGSSLSTAPTPEPPTDFAVSVDLDAPALTCTATMTWTHSTTTSRTAYEIERIETATSVVVAGPFVVGPTETIYVDVVPIPPIGQPYSWRIRTIADPWSSTPVVSTDFDLIACTEI